MASTAKGSPRRAPFSNGLWRTLRRLPRSNWLLALLVLCVFASLAFLLRLLSYDSILEGIANSNRSVIDLQFAWTEAEALWLLATWGEEGRGLVREALALDFAFLVAYGLALFAGVRLVALRQRRSERRSLGIVLAYGSFVAMACDALENLFLLATLDLYPDVSATNSLTVALFATAKFALIFGALTYLLCALTWWLLRQPLGTTLDRLLLVGVPLPIVFGS